MTYHSIEYAEDGSDKESLGERKSNKPHGDKAVFLGARSGLIVTYALEFPISAACSCHK